MIRHVSSIPYRSRTRSRRHLLPFYLVLLCLCATGECTSFAGTTDSDIVQETTRTIVEGTNQLSPPAIHFDEDAGLHVAWFEQNGEKRSLKTTRLSHRERLAEAVVAVNPKHLEPNAIHQAPGLAAGPHDHVFVTWSSAKASNAMFASELQLARSVDGGRTFMPPILVNDDGQSISHAFENLLANREGQVYLAWLDNRNRSKSGAGTVFGCSPDAGKSMMTNVAVDDMACPCCRPMIAQAPDGSIWVAWRKTFDGNVRDIVVAQSKDQGRTFSSPTVVSRDGWAFPACPHRGPSISFDRSGRLYIGWYTEGTDEQPRLLFSVSDDQGKSFSAPLSLHTSTTSLPDQLRMAVHPDGVILAVWEEITGVRKRTVMRVSLDRGRTFGSVQALSTGATAEMPTVAVHPSGTLALAWSEYAWPNNRLVVQFGTLRSQSLP